jgi:hypothetical protein
MKHQPNSITNYLNMQQPDIFYDENINQQHQPNLPLNYVLTFLSKIKEKYEEFSGKHEDKELTQVLDEYHENFIQSAWKFVLPFVNIVMSSALLFLFTRGIQDNGLYFGYICYLV